MSFIDGKPRTATEKQVNNWGGRKGGPRFRCHFCGHKFEVGETWRCHQNNNGNPLVCTKCDDTPEKLQNEWERKYELSKNAMWWFSHDCGGCDGY